MKKKEKKGRIKKKGGKKRGKLHRTAKTQQRGRDL